MIKAKLGLSSSEQRPLYGFRVVVAERWQAVPGEGFVTVLAVGSLGVTAQRVDRKVFQFVGRHLEVEDRCHVHLTDIRKPLFFQIEW